MTARRRFVMQELHPLQLEAYKRMTPAEKLRMVCTLYHAGVRLRVAGLLTVLERALTRLPELE